MAIIIPVNEFQYSEVTESSSRGTNVDYMIDGVYHQKPTDLGGFNTLNFIFKIANTVTIDGLCVASEVTNGDLTWALNYWDGAAYQAMGNSSGLTKGYNYQALTSQTVDQYRLQVTSINSEWTFTSPVTGMAGIDVDKDGKWWVTDNTTDNEIKRLEKPTAGGDAIDLSAEEDIAFAHTTIESLIDNIRGITIGKGKNLWVCGSRSTPQYKVWNIEHDGTEISSFQSSTFDASATTLSGIAYDFSDDTLWVTDAGTNKIYHITTAGALIGTAITTTDIDATLTNPMDICIDKTDGSLWLTCDSSNTVWNTTRDGTLIRSIPDTRFDAGANSMEGIASDWDGSLLICDRTNTNKTYRIWPNFGFYHAFAGTALGVGQPQSPFGSDFTEIDFAQGKHWKLLSATFLNVDTTKEGYWNQLKTEQCKSDYRKPFVFFKSNTDGVTDGAVFYFKVDSFEEQTDFNIAENAGTNSQLTINARAWDIR